MSEYRDKYNGDRHKKAEARAHADPHEKVDSSDWTEAEPLKADVKTGMRPISKRAFKRGGMVEGEKAACNAGRKPRKSGGRAPVTPDSLTNRNVKEANESREGLKHTGGFKKGGKISRKHREEGGTVDESRSASDRIRQNLGYDSPDYNPKFSGKQTDQSRLTEEDREKMNDLAKDAAGERKRGGRTKKMAGGPMSMDPRLGAQAMMQAGSQQSNVPVNRMQFGNPARSKLYNASGLKKGGKAEHSDEKEDKKLIAKMVEKSALKRDARKSGGRTKSGKTNVNIIIAQKSPSNGMPPGGPAPGMPKPPSPPPGMGLPPGLPPGVGAPPPMAAPPTSPPPGAGNPMMGRKSGGRAYPIKDGAGGGEGRLEKIKAYGLKPAKG